MGRLTRERWLWCEAEGRMVPNISRIHVIPIDEDSDDLHVASAECWCNPKVEPQPGCDTDICTHNALAGPDHEGWVLIGERF